MNIKFNLQIGDSELHQRDPRTDKASGYPESDMNEIDSFVQIGTKIYACGHKLIDAKSSKGNRIASMFKMD